MWVLEVLAFSCFVFKEKKMPNYETEVLSLAICQKFKMRIPLSGVRITEHFPDGSAGKESACNVGDLRLIPGLERSPRERLPTPLFWPGEQDVTERLSLHRITKVPA